MVNASTRADAWRRLGRHGEVALLAVVVHLLAAPLGLPAGFVGVQPNPLWFVVLWGGLRGGLLPALFAATLTAMLHACGVLMAAGDDLTALLAPAATWQTFAFFAIAWLVGQGRDVLGEDLQHWRGRCDELQRDNAAQAVDNDVLATANRELKRRVFDRSLEYESLLGTVLERRPDGDEAMFEMPLEMLVDACGATRCSALLVQSDGGIDLAAHHGWTLGEIRPRLAAAKRSERVRAAIASGQPVLELRRDEPGELGPLWLAPIADATGVIKALLCVDEIEPERCDAATQQAFLGVVRWFTASVRRVQITETSPAPLDQLLAACDGPRRVGGPVELAERLHLDDARRQRYRIDTSLLAMRSRDPRVAGGATLHDLEQALVQVLATVVRPTDDLFHFGYPACYVLVLTGCKPGDIEQLVTRLRSRFNTTGDELLAGVELLPFTPGTDGDDLASLVPSLQELFTAGAVLPVDHRCPVPAPRPQRRGTALEFAARLHLELELARRFSASVHLVEFAHADVAAHMGCVIARHLWNAVGTMLRVTDGIYVLDAGRCVVLLPFTECLDASRVQERLREALARTLPPAVHAGVEVRFLSLAEADAKQTLRYLMPADVDHVPAARVADAPAEATTDADVPRGPVVTENELKELAFSSDEFENMHRAQASLANEFDVLRASGVETRLPSPDAIRRRWEEVFGPDPAPTSMPALPAAPAAVVARTGGGGTDVVVAELPPAAAPAPAPAASSPPAAGLDPAVAAAVELVVGAVVRAVVGARPDVGVAAADLAAAIERIGASAEPVAPVRAPSPPAAAAVAPEGTVAAATVDDVVARVEALRRQCLQLHDRIEQRAAVRGAP